MVGGKEMLVTYDTWAISRFQYGGIWYGEYSVLWESSSGQRWRGICMRNLYGGNCMGEEKRAGQTTRPAGYCCSLVTTAIG